jgi:hypothetical protein
MTEDRHFYTVIRINDDDSESVLLAFTDEKRAEKYRKRVEKAQKRVLRGNYRYIIKVS